MADIRNSAPLQTITPSDAALAIVVSLVSAGWLATVHSATTGGAWSGWLGDLLVTGAVMAAMATAALIMVRGRAAAMPAAAGTATRAVAAAVAIGIVAAGTTAIRASALAGAGGTRTPTAVSGHTSSTTSCSRWRWSCRSHWWPLH